MDELTDLVIEGKRCTLLELLDILESNDDAIPNNGVDVTLLPPLNSNEDVSDEDSGPEEDPCIDNLPASQLNATAVITNVDLSSSNSDASNEKLEFLSSSTPGSSSMITTHQSSIPGENVCQSAGKTKKIKHHDSRKYNWKEVELPESKVDWPLMYTVDIEKGRTPLQYFMQFFDEDVVKMIVKYTNQYAAKKNRLGDCSEDELLVFIGILLLSGYIVVPRRRMYWQAEKDSHNDVVANAMSRDRFEFIMSNIHVCDNDNIDKEDRFAKVRQLLCMLNDRFKQFAPHKQCHSVDESMVPYYGRHGCKQFIKGKPIRYGYKLWCGGTSDGYLIWLQPYQGAGTCSKKYENKGMGYGVIMTYADQLVPHIPYRIYFDNLFTSVELLYDLKERGIEATGTIRGNRVGKDCPLSSVEKMKKKNRGAHEACTDPGAGISIVRWNDNNVVTVATNHDRVHPLRAVGRFSREKKKRISVPQPKLLHSYNIHMGGIDRADQNISLYRTSIRGKKWYFSIIAHLIDTAEQNAWHLYKSNEEAIDHLSFRRRVATAILESNKRIASSKGRPSKTSKQETRYDGKNHYVSELPVDQKTGRKKQLKCRNCQKKTTTLCLKCDTPLHVACFLSYHT